MKTLQNHRRWCSALVLLGVLGAAIVGCFHGDFLAGQPCSADSDCGPALNCVEGICGGFVCSVAEVDGVCPCGGDTSYACAELGGDLKPNKIDILFVIDNSPQSGFSDLARIGFNESLQNGLINTLLSDPLAKGLIDYRIAVTTTDNGNPQCTALNGFSETRPRGGEFVLSSCRERGADFVSDLVSGQMDLKQQMCDDRCELESVTVLPTSVEGAGAAKPQRWIEAGPEGTNLAEGVALDAALACILPQGIRGCAWEQQLESLYLALEKTKNPIDDNFGFLRADAHLLIVMASNKVDCSFTEGFDDVFTKQNPFWPDGQSLNPFFSPCWRAGVACTPNTDPPPEMYDDCVPMSYDVNGTMTKDDSAAVLRPVTRYIDQLEKLRAKKSAQDESLQVLFTLIAGVPEDYQGGPLPASPPLNDDGSLNTGDIYGILPGCGSFGDIFGLPPVRMRSVASEFRNRSGANNIFSNCAQDVSGAFSYLAEAVTSLLPTQCMEEVCVADRISAQPGVQPECELTYVDGGTIAAIPYCASGSQGSPLLQADQRLCYFANAEASAECKATGSNMEFGFLYAEDFTPPDRVVASCEPSTNWASDCPSN